MEEHNGSPRSRRNFLRYGMVAGIAALLANAAAALGYFLWPRQVGAFGGTIVAGRLADFPRGTVSRIRDGRFYIAHVDEGLLALYWKCTHLGCTVPWQPDEDFQAPAQPLLHGVFHCPCHGTIFTRSGEVVTGPAPRPLDLMELHLEGDKVVVNTAIILQRSRWEPSQAIRA